MKKTSWKFPFDFPFIVYPLNLNYEKLAKYNPTFLWEKFFSILPKYDKSVSTQLSMLSKFSFPKKGKNKYKFQMENSLMVEPSIL